MARVEAYALAAAFALAFVLGGCRRARGCLSGCPGSGDAGNGPPVTATLAACPVVRGCHHVKSMQLVIAGFDWGGGALVGSLVETPSGLAASWIAAPSGIVFERHIGVSLLEQGQGVQVAVFDRSVDEDTPPPLFHRDGELDLLMHPTSSAWCRSLSTP